VILNVLLQISDIPRLHDEANIVQTSMNDCKHEGTLEHSSCTCVSHMFASLCKRSITEAAWKAVDVKMSVCSLFGSVVITGFLSFLESPAFFVETFRTWKVLEKISLKITHFFIGLNEKQATVVYHPVCVVCCLLKYCIQQFKIFSVHFARLNTCFVTFKHLWATERSWKICLGSPGKSWNYLSVKEWEPCF